MEGGIPQALDAAHATPILPKPIPLPDETQQSVSATHRARRLGRRRFDLPVLHRPVVPVAEGLDQLRVRQNVSPSQRPIE